MSTTDELQRLFTSYGNAMYRNDPDAAEKIAAKFSAALAQQPAAPVAPAPLSERDMLRLVASAATQANEFSDDGQSAQQPAASGEPVAKVRRAHAGGRVRSIGHQVCDLLPGANVQDGAMLYTAPQPAPAPASAPDGTLHADGYFTWAGGKRPAYLLDKGLPAKFWLAAPTAQPAPAPAAIDYGALVAAAWSQHRYAQGSGACIAFKHGAEWQAAQPAPAPDAALRTAVRLVLDATPDQLPMALDALRDHASAAQPAPARVALTDDPWHKLYRRAINEANGLTNYVEDRPELRSAERRLTAIEAEARTLAAAATPAQGEPK